MMPATPPLAILGCMNASTSIRFVVLALGASVLLVACNPAAPPSAPPSHGASPGATAGPSAQATSAPTVTSGPQSAAPSNAAAGSWSVTLTGPRSGAGSYSGVAGMLCGGAGLEWTATGILLTAEITQISVSASAGVDSILVQTPGGIDTGQWFFSGDEPNTTVDVSASGDASGAHIIGHAEFTDMENKHYTADVRIECGPQDQSGGND